MSMKTHILLQRNGRDQFGDPGDPPTHYQAPGLDRRERKEYHDAVDAFFRAHGPAWQRFCTGKTSREIWTAMFPRGKPAFSTFEKIRRAFVSLPEFLKYALVLHRWRALMAMGHSHDRARKILARYEALSRYALEPRIGERKPGRSPGYVPRVE